MSSIFIVMKLSYLKANDKTQAAKTVIHLRIGNTSS